MLTDEAAREVGARRRWQMTLGRQDALLGLLFILPTAAFFAVFILAPLFATVGLSFTRLDLLHPERGLSFAGLRNYDVLLRRGVVQSAFLVSLTITVGTVLLSVVPAIFVALLLNRSFPGRRMARSLLIIPWALPSITTAFTFRWLFDAHFGSINHFLIAAGILTEPVPWLGQPATAIAVVILAHAWKGLPFAVLVVLAGLQTISRDEQEAARIDGAGALHEFWYVTLPHLRFVLGVLVVLRFIGTFNWFDLAYLLTGGGPAGATTTLPVEIYIIGFSNLNIGLGATLATFMIAALIVAAIIFFRVILTEEQRQ